MNPRATVRGISLPLAQGGHRLRFTTGSPDRVWCDFLDIAMLVDELSAEPTPEGHCYVKEVVKCPDLGPSFDLVFGDGQVLRTHQRPATRQGTEPLRLGLAQLILGLERVKRGGTLVFLLHKADSWPNVQLIHRFAQFSDVQLFKSRSKHTFRGSFYLVAKNVDPTAAVAAQCLRDWRLTWHGATFGGPAGTGVGRTPPSPDEVQAVLNAFGDSFIELARPIWKIQADALAKQEFTQ